MLQNVQNFHHWVNITRVDVYKRQIESQRIKTQTKLSQLIEENKTGAGSPGVAAAAMLASVVVTVMYFAVQIAVTIFFVLLILLIPIIVIVSFLGIIITLLSGFAAAVDNTCLFYTSRCV